MGMLDYCQIQYLQSHHQAHGLRQANPDRLRLLFLLECHSQRGRGKESAGNGMMIHGMLRGILHAALGSEEGQEVVLPAVGAGMGHRMSDMGVSWSGIAAVRVEGAIRLPDPGPGRDRLSEVAVVV
jgi:hypothetical protein